MIPKLHFLLEVYLNGLNLIWTKLEDPDERQQQNARTAGQLADGADDEWSSGISPSSPPEGTCSYLWGLKFNLSIKGFVVVDATGQALGYLMSAAARCFAGGER